MPPPEEPSASDPRIAFFDRLASQWDTNEQDPEAAVDKVAAMADYLALRPGENLLEVGCGTGQLTGWLAEQVAPGRVVAVDFSQGMLDRARAKKLPAEFRLADVCQDVLGEGCFDVAFCFHAFPHFRDQAAALRNLARALCDGGRLIVMHLAASAAINAFHDQVGREVFGDHLPIGPQWDTLLGSTGFTLDQHLDGDGLFFLRATNGRSG